MIFPLLGVRGWVSGKLLSEVYLENKSGMYNNEISSFEFILKFWHSTFCISSRIFGSVTFSKVAIIRTKIASFASFSSLSFFLLAVFFSPFLFLSSSNRAQKTFGPLSLKWLQISSSKNRLDHDEYNFILIKY